MFVIAVVFANHYRVMTIRSPDYHTQVDIAFNGSRPKTTSVKQTIDDRVLVSIVFEGIESDGELRDIAEIFGDEVGQMRNPVFLGHFWVVAMALERVSCSVGASMISDLFADWNRD